MEVVHDLRHWADITLRDGTEGTYRHQGLAWLDAAKILQQSGQTRGFGPFDYIVFHACELFVKSFLLWRGVPHSELRSRNIRHDIKKLVDKAKQKGLVLEQEFEPFFQVLENLNSDHKQRYIKLGFYTIGEFDYSQPENMISWAEKLYQKIYEIIQEEKNAKN